MKKGRAIALLPIAVFLVLYLGLGILFEYIMKIPMGFYNVPIVFAFLVAILVACLQNQKVSLRKAWHYGAGTGRQKYYYDAADLSDCRRVCRRGWSQ